MVTGTKGVGGASDGEGRGGQRKAGGGRGKLKSHGTSRDGLSAKTEVGEERPGGR